MSIKRIPGTARGRCKTVEHNGFVWTVATGRGDTVAEQTKGALAAIDANLEEVGTDRHHIVEVLVYLSDMSTKAEMDAVWCAWIPDDGWPCRACVGTDLAPGDRVEIKVTAVK
ncbi:MAG: RidA family protein [Gammaproteobacteria bacterium]|nr:RidA family protein [Gammaproteobacteria bacterium]NIM73717.1 RidA family protein [Gammaproteobacteria bacterium]NIN37391.1 RidA family protein [Gammaproteobacteria bacterium]NIO25550.1 RidA family protein [Gammaproteobacteria bacterium]NIO66225.1 RidA family protein [Gammaproteobacteria bacterium]